MGVLPTELILHILHCADLNTLLKCRQICRDWNQVVQHDVGLVYKQELAIAGMEDGDADMDVAERLRLLRMHQDAWDKLEFTHDEVIYMHPQTPHLSWEVQGGILSQQTTFRSLTFHQIPSKIRGIPPMLWSINDLDIEFMDYGFDPSQDLLVLAEGCNPENPFVHNIHLRSLTDGVRHPLASHAVLHYDSMNPYHHRDIRICGDYLAVCWHESLLVVWEWKSGTLRLALCGEPLSFAFLPHNFLLLARCDEMDMVAINLTLLAAETTVSLPELKYHCVFGLPPLCDGWVFAQLRMQYDLQPSVFRTQVPQVPFRTMPNEERIISLDIWAAADGQPDARIRLLVHISGIMRHILSIAISNETCMVPWDVWGPPHCRSRFRSEDSSWPRNVHASKYVERGFFFADFNQLKYRRSQSRSDMRRLEHLRLSRPEYPVPYFPSQRPLVTTLPFRWQSFSIDRNTGVHWQAALVCEDAFIIAQSSAEHNATGFRVLSI